MAALLKHLQVIRQVSSISLETRTLNIVFSQKRNYKPRFVAPTLRELKRRKDIQDEKNGGPKIFHRSTFLEWNYDAEIFAFANRLGEKFDDHVLRKALTHKSYIENESKKLEVDSKVLEDNSELILSGDEIISRCIRGYLRAIFSRVPEEFIQAVHDNLTTSTSLALVARNIGLEDIILCAEFPCEEITLANSIKAIVAALEQSSGKERANFFVQDLIITQLYGKDVNEIWNPVDPVGILKSILVREGRGEPDYRLVRKAGTSTILSVYHVGIYCNKTLIATGTGENVEVACEMAAREGLKRLFRTEDAMKALPFGRQLKPLQDRITKMENRANVSLSEWTSEKVARLI